MTRGKLQVPRIRYPMVTVMWVMTVAPRDAGSRGSREKLQAPTWTDSSLLEFKSTMASMTLSIIGNQQSQSKAPETWESWHPGASHSLSTPPPQESVYFGASHPDGQNSLSQEDMLNVGNTPLSDAVVTVIQCKTATAIPGAVTGAIPGGAIARATPVGAVAGSPATRPVNGAMIVVLTVAIGQLATLIAGMDQVAIGPTAPAGAGPGVGSLIVRGAIVVPSARTY